MAERDARRWTGARAGGEGASEERQAVGPRRDGGGGSEGRTSRVPRREGTRTETTRRASNAAGIIAIATIAAPAGVAASPGRRPQTARAARGGAQNSRRRETQHGEYAANEGAGRVITDQQRVSFRGLVGVSENRGRGAGGVGW
jgi:hypothetical protein